MVPRTARAITISTRVKAAWGARWRHRSGPNWRESDIIIVSTSRSCAGRWNPAAPLGPRDRAAFAGTTSAQTVSMIQMHSRPKEQREAVRNLVHLVLIRDM